MIGLAKKKPVITNAMRLLRTKKIEFEEIEYETEEVGEDFGEKIAALTGLAPEMSFKTLVARGDKKGVMVACVPVCCEVDMKKFAKAAGDKKVEMIHVKELLGLTGYIRGGVSPIGMKKQYPTYVNASAEALEKIAVSGGTCGVTLVMTPGDLKKATNCVFADIIK